LLETKRKERKLEISILKLDISKTQQENEVFKKVISDSRMDITVDNKDDEKFIKNALGPLSSR
jgi:hypothetical protein